MKTFENTKGQVIKSLEGDNCVATIVTQKPQTKFTYNVEIKRLAFSL